MFLIRFLVIVLLFLPLTGCRNENKLNRSSVEGTVQLDGVPIADGYVMFRPESGTAGPDVAGMVKNGKYFIPVKVGPVPGNYTISVTSSVPTGKKIKAPYTGQEVEETKQLIPDQYTGVRRKSALTAQIESGKNTVNLDLKSK
jgi:hypothetical protein